MREVARACESVRAVHTATALEVYMRLCLCVRVLICFGWSGCAGEGLQQLQNGCAKHTGKQWSIKDAADKMMVLLWVQTA